MSLVAYASSEEDSDSEEMQSAIKGLEPEVESRRGSLFSSLPPPKSSVFNLPPPHGFSSGLNLPAPKQSGPQWNEPVPRHIAPEEVGFVGSLQGLSAPKISGLSLPSAKEPIPNESDLNIPAARNSIFSGSGLHLPPPKTFMGNILEAEELGGGESRLGLPPPKNSGLTLPVPSGGGLNLPKPKKKAEPVKITVPQLQKGDSDSDEDEPAKKKKATQGPGSSSSLSAMLPQPRNLSARETNRAPLLYSFTKNKAADSSSQKPIQSVSPTLMLKPTTPAVLSPSAIKAAAKTAAMQVARQIAQEDEEDDDEVLPGNFFSIPDRTELVTTRTEPYSSTALPEQMTATSVLASEQGGLVTAQQGLPTEQEVFQSGPADAPLEFKTASGPSNTGDGPPGSWPSEDSTNFGDQYYTQYPEYSDASSSYYPDYYSNVGYEDGDPAAVAEDPSTAPIIDEEAFRRLQGKRNRGREEINFLEIKGDDQLSGAQQWLTKSLTEEKNMKSFSKKKGQQPTGQQRRKHQITYLIHQAKERELELKNTWSENKLTRRQTQAKYGF